MRDLARLLKPKSIALFGGGWAANVIEQLKKHGYEGEIWPVHPRRDDIGGIACFRAIDDLPSAPDASFIGVNREATIDVVRQLSEMGAGGATCFASGFRESEGAGGADIQARLVDVAGDMPILGPNCYGFLNYLDKVALWPDQHGGHTVDCGVGIITQSSNIAINMTMQQRGLPIAMLVAAGNQAQTGIADIAGAMLADDRITAIGLYLEGLGDLHRLETFMAAARKAGKPVVVLKTGKSEAAQKAALTHTASMAGSAAFSSALFKRLGMIEVEDVEAFLEALKLLNMTGPLAGNAIASVSCSGGEAGLVADMAKDTAIEFRDFSFTSNQKLKSELGSLVTIANPLDYHTFIWGETERMTSVFSSVMEDRFDLVLCVLDIPRDDLCDPSSFQCAIDAICAAAEKTNAQVAVLCLLPENINEKVNAAFRQAGVVTLNGMKAGLSAVDAAIRAGALQKYADEARPLRFNHHQGRASVWNEYQSKQELSRHGAQIPHQVKAGDRYQLIEKVELELRYPVALKVLGLSHKTEAGGVALNIKGRDELISAFDGMPESEEYLCEEMVGDVLAELIIGVSHQSWGVHMLTIGAGGIYTEILKDSVNLILPVRREEVLNAIKGLRIFPMLDGYRGRGPADLEKLVDAVMAIASCAGKQSCSVELDVNPLMVRADDAIIADALIVTYD